MEIALWIIVAVSIVGFIFLISEVIALKTTMIELTKSIASVFDDRHSQNERYREELKEILTDLRRNNYYSLNEINDRLSNNGFDLPKGHNDSEMAPNPEDVFGFEKDGEEPRDVDPEGSDPFFDEQTGFWYQRIRTGFFERQVRVYPPEDDNEADSET